MTWALASEPPRSDHISPIPVTRVVRGKKSSSLVSYRSPLANSSSPKSKFYFTKRTSSPLANNSSRRTIVHPIQNMLFGELKFVRGGPVRGERSLEVDGFPPANEFSGEPFASSRRRTGELGRTRANSGERSAYSGERSPEFGGVSVLANRWRIRAEFAQVRSSSPEFARVRGERQFAGYTALFWLLENLKVLGTGYPKTVPG